MGKGSLSAVYVDSWSYNRNIGCWECAREFVIAGVRYGAIGTGGTRREASEEADKAELDTRRGEAGTFQRDPDTGIKEGG